MTMIECFEIDFDHRLQTYVMSGRASYEWYLEKTVGAEKNLEIQRSIITGRKTYETLREDLKRGCVLPPIVLSVQKLRLPKELKSTPQEPFFTSDEALLQKLGKQVDQAAPGTIQIIDGLQRTNALRSVKAELQGAGLKTFLKRPIRVEFWLNIPFYALAYRMLLLNAGQKPMSMKHQIEILADSMRHELDAIKGLEILRGLEKRRRVKPGQFQLSTLAAAFQAWIQKQPNVDLRNAVTAQLLAEEAVQSLGSGLNPGSHAGGKAFSSFVEWLVKLDNALGTEHLSFLGNETVTLALSAAVASSEGNPELKRRCDDALERILVRIKKDGAEVAFAPQMFSELRTEIDPKKSNVGQATRDLVYRAFSEYIISGGTKSMQDCWTFASTYL